MDGRNHLCPAVDMEHPYGDLSMPELSSVSMLDVNNSMLGTAIGSLELDAMFMGDPCSGAERHEHEEKQDDTSSDEDAGGEKKPEKQSKQRRNKRKRQQVKAACANCRRSKTACDEVRPCTRCLNRGWECVDAPKPQPKEALKLKPMSLKSSANLSQRKNSGVKPRTRVHPPGAPGGAAPSNEGGVSSMMGSSSAAASAASAASAATASPLGAFSSSPPDLLGRSTSTSPSSTTSGSNSPPSLRLDPSQRREQPAVTAHSIARMAFEGSGVVADEVLDRVARDAASFGRRHRHPSSGASAAPPAPSNPAPFSSGAPSYMATPASSSSSAAAASSSSSSSSGPSPASGSGSIPSGAPSCMFPRHGGFRSVLDGARAASAQRHNMDMGEAFPSVRSPHSEHSESDAGSSSPASPRSPDSAEEDPARLEIELLRSQNLTIRRQNETLRKEISRLRSEALSGSVYSLSQLSNCRVAKSLWDAATVNLAAFNECFVMLSQRPRALLVGPSGFSCPDLFQERHLPKCGRCVALFRSGKCVLARMTQLWLINGREVPFNSMVRCVMDQAGEVTHMLMYSIPTSEYVPGTEYEPEVLEWNGEPMDISGCGSASDDAGMLWHSHPMTWHPHPTHTLYTHYTHTLFPLTHSLPRTIYA
eukprot:TRINITY_DN547_c0_g1_i4.p1 TRINITY_DN547_c0_g1~~TRINITY_DN547_c0_g1_i4.p1  ORF type:complete len:702 (-),score=206.96 TRINITY_DN547_c0_g1_i4:84-2027(-)